MKSSCCQAKSKIVDTRDSGTYRYRQRQCKNCERRYSSYEFEVGTDWATDFFSHMQALAAMPVQVHERSLPEIGRWVFDTIRVFGASESTAYLGAGVFLKGLQEDDEISHIDRQGR